MLAVHSGSTHTEPNHLQSVSANVFLPKLTPRDKRFLTPNLINIRFKTKRFVFPLEERNPKSASGS